MIRKKGGSRAAERNPFYRKVYSPAAPPGMKKLFSCMEEDR